VSRLPVVEGRRLLGIITRADIIRSESLAVTGASCNLNAFPDPSYRVYQTQGPSTGQGRLLVPLANPETAEVLLKLAVSIARDRHYELECLQIIQIPRNRQPSETAVNTQTSRRLLQRAVRYAQRHQVCAHAQIRIAHDIAQAILEVEKQRHIDLILMGWQGTATTSERLFGNTVDVILRQAVSPVLLFKWPTHTQSLVLKRWLVPVAGGPNTAHALGWLPPLMNAVGVEAVTYLCQVYPPEAEQNHSLIEAYVEALSPQCKGQVRGIELTGEVVPTILTFAKGIDADAIVLGASRNGLFSQVLQGNIPEAIARQSKGAILLVRGPTMTVEEAGE
jgi:chloride channel protein, CIC family